MWCLTCSYNVATSVVMSKHTKTKTNSVPLQSEHELKSAILEMQTIQRLDPEGFLALARIIREMAHSSSVDALAAAMDPDLRASEVRRAALVRRPS